MVYHSHNSVPIIKCKIMLLFIVFIVLYQVNLTSFFFETLIFIESCTFVCKSYIDTFTFSTNSLVGSGDRFFFQQYILKQEICWEWQFQIGIHIEHHKITLNMFHLFPLPFFASSKKDADDINIHLFKLYLYIQKSRVI